MSSGKSVLGSKYNRIVKIQICDLSQLKKIYLAYFKMCYDIRHTFYDLEN